jgi:GxxExxY protein
MSNKIELKHREITSEILHAFFKRVYQQLGYGFLEKVYENAMAIELQNMGLKVQQQAQIDVYYEEQAVGRYVADLVVEDAVIVEIKTSRQMLKEHEAQLLNYLRATPYEVGLVLNFGPRPDFRRKAYDNDRKVTKTWKPKQREMEH